MFDDDEDRDGLLIDEHDQSNSDLEKPKTSPHMNISVPDLEENDTFHDIGANAGLNSSREEGELEDDEMDTSSFPIAAKKVEDVNTVVPTPDRKRINGDSETQSASAEVTTKRSKVSMVEKSTCVQSEASQADLEESVFEMEAGSSFNIQLTIVCRLEGTDTVYVSAKWKDRELSGILTDGEPPGFANFMKKRLALNSNNSSESEKNGVGSTPKKRVRGQEAKKKKADDDEEDLDVTGLGDTRDSSCSGGSVKLVEVNSVSLHYCPKDDCEHAYPTSAEMEYHISTIHKNKSVIYENNSTQTSVDNLLKTMVSVQTDTEGLSCGEKLKIGKKETNGAMKDEQSDGISDISSDDPAPVLSKEEPSAGGDTNRPSTSSVPTTPQGEKSLQAAIVQPTQVVPPIAASPRENGLLIPAATFVSPFSAPTSSTVVTPTRDVRTSSASNVSDSASKPVASPAQSRGFHPMMHQQGPGPSQAAQSQMHAQMFQAAQLQQLMMQQMMGGGRTYSLQHMPSAQDLAALQALQAGQYHMFNTKP